MRPEVSIECRDQYELAQIHSRSAIPIRLHIRVDRYHRGACSFAALLVILLLFTTQTYAAQCGGDFKAFIAAMAREAEATGISPAVTGQAFAGVTQDQRVLAFDRAQRSTFQRTFEDYASTRITGGRISRARQLMQRHTTLLARIEGEFGVPSNVLMAIWGLESDYGVADIGSLPVIRVVSTLAHDCRRTELFQGELRAALKILQRGDLPLRDLIGAFAGEIGQTQFLPSSYIKYGVDFDGDGRVDLRHSVPDVLASTANLLKTSGWQAGAQYNDGAANFEVMREWNRAVIYRKTIVLFSERIRGEANLTPGYRNRLD